MSVSDLFDNPVYDRQIAISGSVHYLHEVNSTSFELRSDGKSIRVWYDMMVENDETSRPPVNIDAVQNGDIVVIWGELKTEGAYRLENDFWLSDIALITE